MIRITYGRGNGYHCGCCRSESTYTKDFNTIEEAEKFYTQIEFWRKNPNGDACEDIWFEEAVEFQEVTVPLKINQEHMTMLQTEREAKVKKKAEEEAERERIQDEQQLAYLKAKLEK